MPDHAFGSRGLLLAASGHRLRVTQQISNPERGTAQLVRQCRRSERPHIDHTARHNGGMSSSASISASVEIPIRQGRDRQSIAI